MSLMVALACCLVLTATPTLVDPPPERNTGAQSGESAAAASDPNTPSAPTRSASPESTGSAYFISGSVFLTSTTASAVTEPPRTRRVVTPAERHWNRKTWGFALGLGSFAGAAAALALGFGVSGRNYRAWGRELDTLIADIEAQGGRTPMDELYLAMYDRRMDGARAIMIGTSVTAAVFMGVGAGLLSWSLKGGWSPRRARLNPHGGPQEVGLSLVGRF